MIQFISAEPDIMRCLRQTSTVYIISTHVNNKGLWTYNTEYTKNEYKRVADVWILDNFYFIFFLYQTIQYQ